MSPLRILAAFAASCWMTAATAADWTMDTRTSSLTFVASYQGQAAPGRFRGLSGPHVQYSFTPSLSCTAGLNRSGLALPQFFAGSLPGGA